MSSDTFYIADMDGEVAAHGDVLREALCILRLSAASFDEYAHALANTAAEKHPESERDVYSQQWYRAFRYAVRREAERSVERVAQRSEPREPTRHPWYQRKSPQRTA